MAKQKLIVYITFGVYVDMEEVTDLDSPLIRERAISRLMDVSEHELITESDMEVEDVSEEFGLI